MDISNRSMQGWTCPKCQNASSSEASLKRHIRYCRKKPAASSKRTKSCHSCVRSKTRCEVTFDGCARCCERGISCSLALVSPTGTTVADGRHAKTLRSGLSHLGSDLPASFQSSNAQPLPLRPWNHKELHVISNVDENAAKEGLLFTPRAFQETHTMMSSTMGMGILRSYPSLMRERRTFPPFIHPRCYGTECDGWALPLALVRASNISVQFTCNSHEAIAGIRKEQHRISDECSEMGLEDLLASIQALTIYILLRVADGPSDEREDAELIRVLWKVCQHMVQLAGYETIMDSYSPWRRWVIIESKRRVNSIMRLMRQLYNLDIGVEWPYASVSTATPLPASKLLWNAMSEEEWRRAWDGDSFYRTMSFGDLLDFDGSVDNQFPSNEEWARWYAGADELGILVVISTALL